MATKKKTTKKAASRATAKKKAPAKRAPARKASKPGLMRLTAVSPSLTANDIEKSLAFYRDVLGFAVKQRWEEGGKLLGLEIASGDVGFMMSQDDWAKGRDRQKGVGFRIYCTTNQDVDGVVAKLKTRGAKIDDGPTSEEWGRHFTVTDPDGFKITVVNMKKKR